MDHELHNFFYYELIRIFFFALYCRLKYQRRTINKRMK